MNLKERVGYYFLKRGFKPNTNRRRAVNFQDVTSLGILLSASNESEAREKIQFAQVMRKNWAIPKVKITCMVNVRKPQEWFDQYSGVQFVTNADLNWYSKPKAVLFDDQLDLLISLDLTPTIAATFAAVMTKSKMKVSPWSSVNEPYFDLFINLTTDSTLKEYIKQVEHYLKLINRKAHGTV